MKVSELIECLKAMPQDSLVMHLWDGECHTEINHVWVARNGVVVTADNGMVCYSDADRPTNAPSSKDDPYWRTLDSAGRKTR